MDRCKSGVAGHSLVARLAAVAATASVALTGTAVARDTPAPDERDGWDWSGPIDPEWRAWIRSLIEQLRDDDIRWNATTAGRWLFPVRQEAAPWLRLALLSDDRQQRQIVAEILRQVDGERSELLLRANVEALECDDMTLLRPNEAEEAMRILDELAPAEIDDARRRGIQISNATDSVGWFLEDPGRIRLAAPLLGGQLDSPDPQAAFLSAFLLAHIGGDRWRDAVVPILVASLMENDVGGDAVLACNGLFAMGPEVVPELRRHLQLRDGQAELLLRHLIANLAGDDDPDAVRLCGEVLRDLDFEGDPIVHRDRVRVPRFPPAWRFVPYRASLEELKVE